MASKLSSTAQSTDEALSVPFLCAPARTKLFPGEDLILEEPHVQQPTSQQQAGAELSVFPLYLSVEVTNACNLSCSHCNYHFGIDHYTRDRGFMSESTFNKIIAEAIEHRCILLMNYDGEPFMHPSFINYLRQVSNAELNSYFNTNATLLTPERSAELLSFYKGSIFFSIDGNKEWFEKVRQPASYEQVYENVKAFIAENERLGWPVTVCVNFCNLNQSPEERRAYVEEWLPQVNYVCMGETNDKYGACCSERMIEMHPNRRPVCVVPWMTCGIGHNGDVIPCSIYITRANTADAIFGNVHESSLADIWKNDAFAKFRQMLAKGQTKGTYCEKCERWFSQFFFPEERRENVVIRRNGFWTTFQNTDKGPLNFMKF